jgi:glycosyltransferase involved in cell wall biosynthesis
MYHGRRIAALVPAFNEEAHVGGVIATMPDYVDLIVVVDDASTDGTSGAVLAADDDRVRLIRHPHNGGLGASLSTAHRAALAEGADISVVMAGDGQMDPAYLPRLLDPIADLGYDFAKGNRFFAADSWRGMPWHRVLGNLALTILTKAATGYWDVFDPQNGYTAMARGVQQRVPWQQVASDYSFENDVLAHLGVLRARIKDVDIPAVYGDEVSHMQVRSAAPRILATLTRALVRRMWLRHIVRGPSVLALLGLGGLALCLWALAFGAWVAWQSLGPPQASPATVMLAVGPLLLGCELLLAALLLDIADSPR